MTRRAYQMLVGCLVLTGLLSMAILLGMAQGRVALGDVESKGPCIEWHSDFA